MSIYYVVLSLLLSVHSAYYYYTVIVYAYSFIHIEKPHDTFITNAINVKPGIQELAFIKSKQINKCMNVVICQTFAHMHYTHYH